MNEEAEAESWINLKYLMKRIYERRFGWLLDSRLKYMQIRIDARDDRAVLLDRDGMSVAQTEKELDDLFDKLNAEADQKPQFGKKGCGSGS